MVIIGFSDYKTTKYRELILTNDSRISARGTSCAIRSQWGSSYITSFELLAPICHTAIFGVQIHSCQSWFQFRVAYPCFFHYANY